MDRRIFGLENEYGVTCTFRGQRRLSPDEVARYLFRRVVSWGRSSNVFLENGARLYLDVGSHPEYATPECDSVLELITHDKAGERILESLLAAAEARLHEEGIAGQIFLFKNNTDSAGNSYGCHENYLVSRYDHGALDPAPVPRDHVDFVHDVDEHLVHGVFRVRGPGIESPDHHGDRVPCREPEVGPRDDERDGGNRDPEPHRVEHQADEERRGKRSGSGEIKEHQDHEQERDAPVLLPLYVDKGKGHGGLARVKRKMIDGGRRTKSEKARPVVPAKRSSLVPRRILVGLSPYAQVHSRHHAGGLFGLEILFGPEVEQGGDEAVREHLDLRAVVRHQVVVELAGEGDPVLGGGELLLELHDVFVALERRVVLHDREEPAERLGEDVLRLSLGLERAGGDGPGPGRDHFFQCVLLELHGAFDRGHEVRDEVMPPFELYVDLFPGILDVVPQRYEAIVDQHHPERQ